MYADDGRRTGAQVSAAGADRGRGWHCGLGALLTGRAPLGRADGEPCEILLSVVTGPIDRSECSVFAGPGL